jgi:hypothetical protein
MSLVPSQSFEIPFAYWTYPVQTVLMDDFVKLQIELEGKKAIIRADSILTIQYLMIKTAGALLAVVRLVHQMLNIVFPLMRPLAELFIA